VKRYGKSGYRGKKSWIPRDKTYQKAEFPKASANHTFDFVDMASLAPSYVIFKTLPETDLHQARRVFNLTHLLPTGLATSKMSIYLRGVKIKPVITALMEKRVINYRCTVFTSTVYAGCNQVSGMCYIVGNEGVAGNIDDVAPYLGIKTDNVGGSTTPIHSLMYTCMDGSKNCRDVKGTLSVNGRAGWQGDIWVPLNTWITRDNVSTRDWSLNVYVSVLIEMAPNGLMLKKGAGGGDPWSSFAFSGKLYYRHK
jgi:hypothetical protein